ncbi:GlxA family transcriptional regulator, partial [Nocardia tengchongensis]|uniref:GlxA family transcriptional regulator n=1 Tax=Nocardia tengchongensis TaxID=2055889 RepID=UPI0036963D0A
AGARLRAAAGLRDGYRATTHWGATALLAQRYPRVTVEPDRIYVRDRNRWTSAGMSAGVDLALALVEDDHGRETAAMIARVYVVFTRRPGGQAQFSAQLRSQPARTPAIRAVQQWLPDHLGAELTVSELAARAGMSERHFARAFRAETGCTPAAFVEDLRVEAARRLLESTELTIGAIARQVGYRHGETLHRVFTRRLATTPERYRQHFAMSPAQAAGTSE